MFSSSFVAKQDRQSDAWDNIFTTMLRNVPIIDHEKKRYCIGALLNIRGVQGSDLWPRFDKIRERWLTKIGHPHTDPLINLSYTYGKLNG
jgi:hypothetical protein